MRWFTKEHEWVELTGDEARIGITNYAQSALGDVVYVELPAVGATVTAHKESAVVESVKAASDVYAPISGVVTAINNTLNDDPGLVNRNAESDGWFYKIRPTNPDELKELLNADDYTFYIRSLG